VFLIAYTCYLGQHSNALKLWDIEVISETVIAERKETSWQDICNVGMMSRGWFYGKIAPVWRNELLLLS